MADNLLGGITQIGTFDEYKSYFGKEGEKDLGIQDFFALLAAQMKNQDFQNPMDNTQFIAQMAQFSTLTIMQEMSQYSNSSYATSLVDKNVTIAAPDEKGDVQIITDKVEKVVLAGGAYEIYVRGKAYTLKNIMAVESSNPGGLVSNGFENLSAATSLIGKKVGVMVDVAGSETEQVELKEGIVTSVTIKDGKFQFFMNGLMYPTADIVSVSEAEVPAIA